MKHKRAYKYRFVPIDEQKRALARTFGCARFVYNHFLHLRKQAYLQEHESFRYHQTSKKRQSLSAEYTRSAFTWDGAQLTLAKMEEPLAIRWSRPLPTGAKPATVTVTRDAPMTAIATLLKMCWPRGSRCQPVARR